MLVKYRIQNKCFLSTLAWPRPALIIPGRFEQLTQSASAQTTVRVRPELALGALGVVYGDIGTSPLYTLRECLKSVAGVPDHAAVLGVLSLIFWTIATIVTIKYVLVVMRADNNGEGGTLALLALVLRSPA